MDTLCVFEGKNHQEALIVLELLETNDIPSLMPNNHLSSIVPYYSLATGGFKIFVSENSFEEAAKLLLSNNFSIHNAQQLAESSPENKKKIVYETCPNCGQLTLETKKKNRFGLIISFFLLCGIPIQASKFEKICNNCDYKLDSKKTSSRK